jgi:hypothetical protein
LGAFDLIEDVRRSSFMVLFFLRSDGSTAPLTHIQGHEVCLGTCIL